MADRPEGRPPPGDLDGIQRHPARPQVPVPQDAFKAHIAAEPDTGLITNAALTKANGEGTGDDAAGAVVLAGDDSLTEPGQVLADSEYGTGDLLNDLHEAGHDPVIKPWPCTPNIPGGFGVDDFTVDHDTPSK